MSTIMVDASEVDGVWTVAPRGDVDSSNSAELRSAIRRTVGAGRLVIDLRAVPFMDSAGLGALICGIREVRSAGGSAALCVRRGPVARLLEVTGFDRIVPTVGTPAEAGNLDASQEQAQP